MCITRISKCIELSRRAYFVTIEMRLFFYTGGHSKTTALTRDSGVKRCMRYDILRGLIDRSLDDVIQ